ncbi:TraR/DksA family transcriptional regulator [Azonexus sp.]|uniref:TraR/DksA family transcriptional regulator n=1 Tax=Azonexus sp. TaxID=1872668 RepID=UPI0035B02050
MTREQIQTVATLVMAACCFAGGWAVEGWRKDAQIAELKREREKEIAGATQGVLERLVKANERGDTLVLQLATTENQRDKFQRERDHALNTRLTRGVPCLGGAAVGVLNLPDGAGRAALSQAASEPVRADGPAATDTDVALWISFAKRSYDTCRGRLRAIAAFYGDGQVTDVFGRAQEREEEMRQDALAEQARRAQSNAGDSAEDCAMCGEPIPEGRRQAVPGVQTCIECQADVERMNMLVKGK